MKIGRCLLWLMSLALLSLTFSCSLPLLPSEPTSTPIPLKPEPVAQAFLSAWESGDYEAMYALLTSSSKATADFERFARLYRDVAAEATVTSISAHLRSSLQEGERAQVYYKLRWETILVGPVEVENTMTLRLDEGTWKVEWSPGLIFPGLSERTRLHMQPRIPSRGNIYDRNGLGLAVEGIVVEVGVVPGEIEDEEKLLSELSRITGLQPERLKARYARARPDWFVPLADIQPEVYEANASALESLPGISLKRGFVRAYRDGGLSPHLIGYMGAIDQAELSSWVAKGYLGDEMVGRAGVERWGEEYLAGRRGGVLTLITSEGQPIATIKERPALPSRSIYTTLDRELQRKVQTLLEGRVGAIVVLDPKSGQVLALASSPAFDPNEFVSQMNPERWQAMRKDPSRPLLNRALQGTYAPGSVFKIVTMATALDGLGLAPETTFYCAGTWYGLGKEWLKTCWLKRGHGTINLQKGLAASCDVVFYELGLRLQEFDPGLLAVYAKRFGLGERIAQEGFDDAAGLIPDPAWKEDVLGETWFPGDSVNLAIGQGYLLVTPLQVAALLAAVGNGGMLYQPQFILKIEASSDEGERVFAPVEIGRLPISPEHLSAIQTALHEATSMPYGTAFNAFRGLDISVAGKTGTAENPGGEPHAWFAGYAPAEDPQMAAVVVIEQGGEGSKVAAPIFRQVVEAFFATHTHD